MTLHRILQAAVNSMIHGHHAPHCYHAHVPGKGYVNDGSAQYDRADYLRQLERTATLEMENIGWAESYAECGYQNEQPRNGVVFANWNNLPKNLDKILERAGYAVEWSDEWMTCAGCNRALRTCEDSYDWEPSYVEESGEFVCRDCATPDDNDDDTEQE